VSTRRRHDLVRPILAVTSIVIVIVTAWVAAGVDFSTGPAVAVWGFRGSSAVWALGFVGAGFLADRARPDIPVGILMMLAGVSAALQELSNQITLRAGTGMSTGLAIMFQSTLWSWMVPLAFLITAMLRFPDGTRLGARWRRVETGLWIATALAGLVFTIAPTPVDLGVVNPLEVKAWSAALEVGSTITYIVWQLFSIVGISSIVVRLRRSQGMARQQVKWVAFAGATVALLVLVVEVGVGSIDGALYPRSTALVAVSILFIPIAMAMAMLRYRLYDVDRVVSRSVSYSLVAAVLGLVYAGGVVALQNVSPASGNLAVAASTLAVAVLFNPVRLRVQGWVDRHFNRASYDAAKEVDAFTSRLRSAVDPASITGDLKAVLANTIQPSSAMVWIRSETPGHVQASKTV
jgi:hypothetical protein